MVPRRVVAAQAAVDSRPAALFGTEDGLFLTALALAVALVPTTDQAFAAVDAFFAGVVRYHPLGVPEGAARQELWPRLSARLRRRLTEALACERDYARQQPRGSTDKPEYGWLESGLFSGENENALPEAAEPVHTEEEGRGRLRVYVRLTYRDPYAAQHPDLPAEYQWYAAAVLVPERGTWRVDDVVRLDDETLEDRGGIEEVLAGCVRGRWVGAAAAR